MGRHNTAWRGRTLALVVLVIGACAERTGDEGAPLSSETVSQSERRDPSRASEPLPPQERVLPSDIASDGRTTDQPCEAPDCDPEERERARDGEPEACAGQDCELECPPMSVARDGACVCEEGRCLDPQSGACIAQWAALPGADLSLNDAGVLFTRRVDLLARYVDMDQVRAHIDVEFAKAEALLGSQDWRWQAQGYKVLATPLCSMFQFESADWPYEEVHLLLDSVRDVPTSEAYMSLVLSGLLLEEVDLCAFAAVAHSFQQELSSYVESGADLLPVKGSLTRLLVTKDILQRALPAQLLDELKALLYPEGEVEVKGVWDSELIFDLVLAAYFDLEFDSEAILAALDAWWHPIGGVELVDCEGFDCPLKGVHQVVMMDAIHDFIPEDKLVQLASVVFSNVGKDGSFGFPALFGLAPAILWTPTYCDIFCSSKHWHIGVAMHHLATKLQHREADIKAGIAMLDLALPAPSQEEALESGASCVSGQLPECAPGDYCLAGGCGDGLLGVCTPRPASCPAASAPVCACDGNTYASTCFAAQASQFVLGEGPCPESLVGCEVKVGPSSFLKTCAADEYCFGGCVGAGYCKKRPLCGDEPIEYVCGCDGLTYQNTCTLASAGRNFSYAGSCAPPEVDVPIEACAGEDALTCSDAEMLCDLQGCEAGAEGYCLYLGQPQAGVEEAIYCAPFSPECGCDNQTYASQCERVEAGVGLAHPGPCVPGDEASE